MCIQYICYVCGTTYILICTIIRVILRSVGQRRILSFRNYVPFNFPPFNITRASGTGRESRYLRAAREVSVLSLCILHPCGRSLRPRAPFDRAISSARRPIRAATVINLLIIPREDRKWKAGSPGAARCGAARQDASFHSRGCLDISRHVTTRPHAITGR